MRNGLNLLTSIINNVYVNGSDLNDSHRTHQRSRGQQYQITDGDLPPSLKGPRNFGRLGPYLQVRHTPFQTSCTADTLARAAVCAV